MEHEAPLMPINILKRVMPENIDLAEFVLDENEHISIYLNSHEGRTLIAKKTGDEPRKWRSADRAIEFLRMNFKVKKVIVCL